MPSITPNTLLHCRRHFLYVLRGLLILSAGRTALAAPGKPPQDPSGERKLEELLAALTGRAPMKGGDGLDLEIPGTAENGAMVPVRLSDQQSSLALYLIAEGNPGPLLAEFHFKGTALPQVSFRVKLNQSGPVLFLSHRKDGWAQLLRKVRVAVGGCG